jgi:hypothetical protein
MQSDQEAEGPVGPETKVWLGSGTSVEGEEFLEALEAVENLQESVAALMESFEDMSMGLDKEDAKRLIYGRNSDLALRDVDAAFHALESIAEEEPEEFVPRMLEGQMTDLTLGEAAEVWGDLLELREKYGDTEDDA